MAKLLVLANLELSIEIPDGTPSTEELSAAKERALHRLLRRFAREEKGSLETMEFEAFAYTSDLADQGEASGYYYNKHERVERQP